MMIQVKKIFLILWITCGELNILVFLMWIKFNYYVCDKWCMTLLILTYFNHSLSIL
jgi:hypothetical protein